MNLEHKKQINLRRAKEFRRNMTYAERKLWSHIRDKQLGVKFRRQAVQCGYILDFYCPSHHLCIEVDGKGHNTKEQKEYDKIRGEILFARKNIRTLRLSNEAVINYIRLVLKEIQRKLPLLPVD